MARIEWYQVVHDGGYLRDETILFGELTDDSGGKYVIAKNGHNGAISMCPKTETKHENTKLQNWHIINRYLKRKLNILIEDSKSIDNNDNEIFEKIGALNLLLEDMKKEMEVLYNERE